MRRIVFFLLISFLLVWLSACAGKPAASPAAEAPASPVTQEEQKEVAVTHVVQATAAPAAESPFPTRPVVEEPASPTPVQAQKTPLPTFPVIISPTSRIPQPTKAALVERRLVELEWPGRMRLGDSDIIRLSLVPSPDGYVLQPEFPEHQAYTETVRVQRLAGYELSGVARLDGVGFRISPQGDRQQSLPAGEKVTWQWSLTPLSAGQQRLVVFLWLRWTPLPGEAGSVREAQIYSRGLEVQVSSFFGMTRQQAMTGGFFGLLFGGGLSLFGLSGGLFLRRKLVLFGDPNPALVVEPRQGLSLQAHELALLRTLFRRYARLVLESEFLSGYSGARTFLALPVRLDGRADAHTIVKIGDRQSIQREYENYELFVRDTLPPITARIQHVPVTVRNADKAALQYTFIGEPGKTPTSLRQALLQAPDPSLLLKLFETFGPNWWMQRRPYTFRLALEYDRLLPTYLVIQPEKGVGKPLDGRSSPDEAHYAIGDLVTLHNFSRWEKRPDGQSLSLGGMPAPGQPALRLRWLGLAHPNGASGRVVATRRSLLLEAAAGFDRLGLPDPLERLPALLSEMVSGTQSTIHGDLNLENILVGLGDFVWLIDFAMTREGHTLFDFAHLGAEVIGHVIGPQIQNPVEFLDGLQAVFKPGASSAGTALSPVFNLLGALQEIASRCLFNPSQPREFYLSLYMACLGTMKYINLQPGQKYLLYLSAAHLSQLL